jgi:hypothetical protein
MLTSETLDMPAFPPSAAQKGAANSAPVHRAAAVEFCAPLLPLVIELRQRGLSLRAIARELQQRGIKTRQEWPHWSATQVRRLLGRAVKASATVGASEAEVGPPDHRGWPRRRSA